MLMRVIGGGRCPSLSRLGRLASTNAEDDRRGAILWLPPRLILAHLNREALLHDSPRIEVESSLTAFVKRVLKHHSPNTREIGRFKDQLTRLSAALGHGRQLAERPRLSGRRQDHRLHGAVGRQERPATGVVAGGGRAVAALVALITCFWSRNL